MKDWSDEKLWNSTHALVDEERRISVEVVRHLMEIKRRRLYAERGFESMWECLIEEFKLSKGAAQNRLNVIRVLEEHPELASHLESGNLCFTVVSELARVCRELEKEPSELLPLILGKSSREATRALLDLLPAGKHREGFRDLPGGLSELRLILTADQREIFEELRAIKSHTSRTYSSMLVKLADDDLQKHDPVRRSKVQAPGVTNPYSTHVPRALRDQVWVRDGGRCTYKDPVTGRVCGSKNYPQVDHIDPRSLGGKNELSNLRLLCREHNLLHAAQCFGKEFMETFRN